MKRRYRELDDAIAGIDSGDAELTALADTARDLEEALDAPTLDSARERAFFLEAVASRRRRRGFWGALAPVLAGAAVVGAFAFAARSALPGEQIYPLRKAIAVMGLADSPNEEIDERLARARTLVNSAEETLSREPERAVGSAIDAIVQLDRIERLLTDVGIVRRMDLREEIDALERRAAAVITASIVDDESSGPSADERDGSSGPGGDGDSSGPGGGGDDEQDDDNSGPGSDDSSGTGSGDDSSGSGSGHDDSGSGGSDDNSGPGGGD